MADQNQKRVDKVRDAAARAALSEYGWKGCPRPLFEMTAAEGFVDGYAIGYDAAIADNAERVRTLENRNGCANAQADLFAERAKAAESALAEARATIERLQGELRGHATSKRPDDGSQKRQVVFAKPEPTKT